MVHTTNTQLPILILHGWGVFGDKYSELTRLLEKDGYSVYAPDFPGFGKEPLHGDVMVLDDYVTFIREFLKKHHMKKVIIIAHSFGGRVAAKLAASYPTIVDRMVITGSPLIKRKLSLKKQIIAQIVKGGKKGVSILPAPVQAVLQKMIYRSIGEWDYYKAGKLKETFKQIINEDVSSVLGKISVPVLLVWGEQDTMVPVVDGKDIAARIPHAIYKSLPASHRLPYEYPDRFYNAIKEFIQ